MLEKSAPQVPTSEASLYEQAPCGLLVTTTDGLIVRVNRTFCAWVGREADELVGRRRLQDLLTMGGRIFHQTHWGPLMAMQGSIAEIKLEVVHKDGRKLPTVWNAVRRMHDDVTLHEVAVFVAEDRHRYEQELMLARRRAEESLALEKASQLALQAAQQERDRLQALAEDRALFAEQMVGIVSHDLRNPLAVINMCSLILSHSELTDKQQLALGRLTSSSRRALRLIGDLLDFSRERLGGALLQIDFESIDLHAVVAEALADIRLANPDRAIEHRCIGTGACLGNGDRLTQLIGNLVSNALTYGRPETPIVVASSSDAQACSISVHNEGSEIPKELLPRLFDPMTRGTPQAGNSSSIGLGLFIVRQIVQAHAGSVDVVSSNAGGTTFTARFPRGCSTTGCRNPPI